MKKIIALVTLFAASFAHADMLMVAKCPSGYAMFEKGVKGNKITIDNTVYPFSCGTQRFIKNGKAVTAQCAAVDKVKQAAFVFAIDDLVAKKVFVITTERDGEWCDITEDREF